MLDGGFAGPHVAAGLSLGGRGRHEQLFGGDAAENTVERGIALGVARDARHLDLMHGVDQAGGRAGLAEDVAHVGDFRDARSFAAQGLRNLHAEQTLFADFRKGLAGETRFGVDRRGVGLGSVGSRARARRQIILANTYHPGSTRHSLRFHLNSPQSPVRVGRTQDIMRRVPLADNPQLAAGSPVSDA